MICPNCGKEYNDRMTCCISCGSDLVPYEQISEPIRIEPIIPDIKEPEKLEQTGFIRAMEGHSEYPPTPAADTMDEEIPVIVKKNTSVSEAVKDISSFAAAAVMLALIVLAAASAAVRLITDGKKISEFAGRLDVMNLPAEKAVTLVAGDYEISSDATVQEAVYVMSTGTGLTKEDIRRIYESSTAEDFLTDQLNGYAGFIREGEIPEKLTPEKLKEVFSENISLISSAIGKPLSQHDIDLAFEELDRTGSVLEAISPSKIENAIDGGILTILRLFCSVPVMIGEAVAAAAVLVVLWAINRRPEKVLIWGGGAVFAGGAAVLILTFLAVAQVFLSGQDRFVRSIAKCVTDVISPDLYRMGGTLTALGIVMLIWAGTLIGRNHHGDPTN
ncbi:MAG: zinc ribbon domain-containing protein [Oscillospiraceae bacterium]|nr:zinc ribbon domain-containing protein [Oscillospiraceae bacterium]